MVLQPWSPVIWISAQKNLHKLVIRETIKVMSNKQQSHNLSINRSFKMKRGMVYNPLFIIPDFDMASLGLNPVLYTVGQ